MTLLPPNDVEKATQKKKARVRSHFFITLHAWQCTKVEESSYLEKWRLHCTKPTMAELEGRWPCPRPSFHSTFKRLAILSPPWSCLRCRRNRCSLLPASVSHPLALHMKLVLPSYFTQQCIVLQCLQVYVYIYICGVFALVSSNILVFVLGCIVGCPSCACEYAPVSWLPGELRWDGAKRDS